MAVDVYIQLKEAQLMYAAAEYPACSIKACTAKH